MFYSKMTTTRIVLIVVFLITMFGSAVAGEKIKHKAHGATINENWQPLEVGDAEGHVIATYTSKQIFFDENTGERYVSSNVNFMDINTKTGQGFMQGYGTSTHKDGKIFRSFKGKPVGKNHWQGTYTVTNGTGKYEGVKGAGTWDAHILSPGQSHVEVEGEFETP